MSKFTNRILLFSILLLAYAQESYSQTEIDLDVEHQLIRGFGGMNHTVWIDDLNEDQREKAFGNDPGQLGLSILRMHIDPNSSAWNLEVPTALHALSNGALVFATPWDPPAELLEPGSSPPRIPSANYADYVEHLNAFDSYMADNEVPLYAISVQNEPDYPGGWTQWTTEEMVSFMKNHAQNIENKVMAPESFQFRRPLSDAILNDDDALANLDIVGGHIYGGGLFDYPLAREKGKEVWMTEHYTSSDRSANLWPDALLVGVEIHDNMEANFNAYVWWYIRRFYGLITDDGNISKRGYVFAHYSKFIRPGFKRVDVSGSPGADVTAYHAGDSLVIVAVNNTDSPVDLDISIANGSLIVDELTKFTTSAQMNLVNEGSIAVTSNAFASTLSPRSISTFTTHPGSGGKADNEPPVAVAGDDITVTDEDNNGTETILLDGSASSDSDGSIVNYSWSRDGNQISFSDSESITLPTGTHEIILTVTDDDGARAMDTLTVTVNLPETANEVFIWLDAECGNVGTNWLVEEDASASNGKYVTVTPGVQALESPADEASLLTFTFDVDEPGNYKFWARMTVPSPDDDSFWVRMDDGEWVFWNSISGGSDWEWDDLHDSNNASAVVTFNLDEGSHTLAISYREDGALLDKILLTNTGNTPEGMGEADPSCPQPPPVTSIEESAGIYAIQVYPNPAKTETSIASKIPFDGIVIYSMEGREVLRTHYAEATRFATLSLNLKSGLYILHINGSEGTEVSKILIEN